MSFACESGHSDIAKFLIEAGAIVNVVEEVCCTCMCIHMVEIYLEFIIIVLFQSGKTPLLQACSRGLSEVALLLIDKEARVNGVGLSVNVKCN